LSGLIADKVIQDLISTVDLVAHMRSFVELRKSSDHFVGKCPFHEDSTPSFHVYSDHYHCYGCNAHGNILRYEMFRTGAPFREVAIALAEKYSIPIVFDESNQDQKEQEEKKRLFRLMGEVQDCFVENLVGSPGEEAREYLRRRGLTQAQVDAWRFGFAPRESTLSLLAAKRGWTFEDLLSLGLVRKSEHGSGYYDFFRERVMIPIRDEQGRCIAFAGRLLPSADRPGEKGRGGKYMNSPETPLYQKSRILFNLDRARASISRHRDAVVVEGYMDCISLANAGVENVVAACGTALGKDHLQKLTRYASRVLLCFDSDAAGQAAAQKSFKTLFPYNLAELLHVKVPEGKDPDDFVRRQGAKAFGELTAQAQPLLLMVVDAISRERGTLEGTLRAVQSDVIPVIQQNPDRAQQAIALRVVAERLGLVDASMLLPCPSELQQKTWGARSAIIRGCSVPQVSEAVVGETLSSDGFPAEGRASQLSWKIDSLFELRLVLELFCLERDHWFSLGAEFCNRVEQLQSRLKSLGEQSAVFSDLLAEVFQVRRAVLEEVPEGCKELLSPVGRVAWAVVCKDRERLSELGFPSWPAEKEPPRHGGSRGIDVFSPMGARLLNFVLSDVESSVRRNSITAQVQRTLLELERSASWHSVWDNLKVDRDGGAKG
jgi:DNA primase catalytic core